MRLTGHDGIRAANTELRYWLAPSRLKGRSKIDVANVYLDHIHGNNEAALGPYFRLVYSILRRIRDDDVLSAAEKAQYGNLLRSQLTSEELSVLAVNALSPVAADMQQLLTEFSILKYLPQSSLQRLILFSYGSEVFAARD